MRRERSFFHWALLASLLLHLVVLLMIVPGVRQVWPDPIDPVVQIQQQEPQHEPLQFEFVDLADDREETPENPEEALLSDMDRRAHGGEGAPDPAPASQGNTPMLVQADGGRAFGSGAPPQMPGPPAQVPQPEPDAPDVEPADEQAPTEPQPEGRGQPDEPVPTPKPRAPKIQLPPPGTWAMPPDVGGTTEIPDRPGGSVDTGGLSFDTQWYDWGPYAKKMLAKIRRNWDIPEIARLGVPGAVRIRFFLERDGTVTGLSITDESGRPPMDFAARDAILDSSPFLPLPPDLVGIEREGVVITFYYNSRPPN